MVELDKNNQNDNKNNKKVIKMIIFALQDFLCVLQYNHETIVCNRMIWCIRSFARMQNGALMKEKQFAVPAYTTAEDIRNVRKELGLSQQEFAKLLGCSKPTVVRMEASNENITGPIVLAIYALEDEAIKNKIILPEMKYRLRLTYMFKQSICTIIEVDEMNEKVEIINYNSNILFQAFGANKQPTFQDYNDFLESRCFPRTRDKMKIQLGMLNLPFYDPMMIIEKTAGRMAEDDFWLKVERK